MTSGNRAELPNPFLFESGQPVRTADDWARRRGELAASVVAIEYGGLPPAPASTEAEHLHTTTVKPLGGAQFVSYRVLAGPAHPFSFLMTLLIPAGDGPFPVVLTGDVCWRYANDAVAAEVVRRGYILAQFNRVEIAPDVYTSDRVSGLYRACPGGTYGALAAWAWGYHRCVDVLVRMPVVDAARIAVVGHSRGGKAVLLAGATDERIALTAPNNSGCGGSGCYRWQGPESETLAAITRAVPYWFAPGFGSFAGREAELPFDQHFLKALVAPRAFVTTEALGDLWANPTGTWQTNMAAREVYRFLGAEERIGFWCREGEHSHGLPDWCAFLDFMDWQLAGRPCATRFGDNPFPDMPPLFAWRAATMRAQ